MATSNEQHGVWTVMASRTRTPRIERLEGAKLGAKMVTLPDGQRTARTSYGAIESYYATAAELATAVRPAALRELAEAEKRVAGMQQLIAQCDAVLNPVMEG